MEVKNQKKIGKGIGLILAGYLVYLTTCGTPRFKNDEGIRFLYWNENKDIAVYVEDGEKYGLLNFDNEGNYLRSKKMNLADKLTSEMYKRDYPKLSEYGLTTSNPVLGAIILDKIYPVAKSYQRDSLKKGEN